jgi:hypothetical protein
VAELEGTACVALGYSMESDRCGSTVIASVARGCLGVVDMFMLGRPSYAVVMAPSWPRTVSCISVSSVFEAGSTVAAVSTAWAGVAVAAT